MKKLCILLMVLFSFSSSLFADVLLEDTFADADRTETSLPNESAVWVSHTDRVVMGTGSLAFAQSTDSSKMWTYFAPNGSPAMLRIGDKLIATIEFSPRVAFHDGSSRNFRFGLFNDPTNDQLLQDTNSDNGSDGRWMDSTGYAVQFSIGAATASTIQVGKRTDQTNLGLLSASAAYSWSSSQGGASGCALNTVYTMVLTLDYQAADRMQIDFTFNGGSVSTGATLTDNGTLGGDPIWTNFDQLFFRLSSYTGTAEVIDYHKIKIEYIPSPESLTWASDPDPADNETDVAIDLSDRIIPNNLSWTAPIDPNIAEIKGYNLYLDPNDVKVSSRDAGCQIAANITGGVTQYNPASDFNYNQKFYWIVDTHYTRDDDPNLGTPDETIYVGTPYLPWSFTAVTASPVIETYNSVVITMDLLPAALSAVVTDGDNNVSSAAFAVTSSPAGSSYILTQNVSDPYAPSATLDPNMPGTYVVKLTVTDVAKNTTEATAQVDVYDDACAAAQAAASWDGFNDMDFDTDCDVDIADLAAFSQQWLDDRNLKAQDTPAP